MQTVPFKQLANKMSRENGDLIDVRMPTECQEVRAEGVVNVPLDGSEAAQLGERRICRISEFEVRASEMKKKSVGPECEQI